MTLITPSLPPSPVSGYHLSMSDSEASNISMCSSESLNSCQRQAPAGEETHVSGQPGYLHTGCHQYRNNMLAHLLHSPTNSGVTKKTHDGYYESSKWSMSVKLNGSAPDKGKMYVCLIMATCTLM